MPDVSGVSIAKEFKTLNSDIIIIVITGYGSIESARELFKLGIMDYVLKPFKLEEIYHIITKELEILKTKDENIKLKKEILNNYKPENIIGESKQMKEVYKKIIQIAPYNINVLIEGESGIGKELVANAIHYSLNRKNFPFYPINCGAIPRELLENEIFLFFRKSEILRYMI